MLRVKLIFLLIIFSGEVASSQQIYFNNRYPFESYNWNSSLSIVECDSSFITSGGCGDSLNYFWNKILFRKIDKSGEVEKIEICGDTIARHYSGYPGSLHKKNDNYIYLAGAKQYYDPIVFNSGYLMALTNDLDTMWTKEFFGDVSYPIDSSCHFNDMDVCENGDLIFTGELYIYHLPSKTILLRSDSLGNQRWIKYFGSVGINSGYSVVETSDHGFAIGCYQFDPENNNSGDPLIIKTDSLGVKQWEKNIGGPFPDNAAMLSISSDSSIVVGTMYSDSIGGTDPYSRVHIIKVSEDGTILWDKKYGDSKVKYNHLRNIRCLDDGNIIACGDRTNDPPHRSGWMMKLASNGDSLWFRYHDLIHGQNSLNYLYDFVHTEDEDFIACGYVIPIAPDTGYNDAWIIRLDSFGCDTPGCQTVNIVEVPDNSYNSLKIFPNPANTEIQIDLPILPNVGSSLLIYDLFGRKQDEVYIPRNQYQARIDISQYSPGVYIAVLKDENKILGRGKFIKR